MIFSDENAQINGMRTNSVKEAAVKNSTTHAEASPVEATAVRHQMLQELPILMLAEEALLAAAINGLDDHIRGRLRHAMAFQVRCGMIGDAEGVITSDDLIESLICEAAGESASARELKAMKQPFKDAWRATHRLRDMKPDVELRMQMVTCILAGDETGAVACIRRFYAGIGQRI
jgi:DNA-binding GntR family transcriptional regulator